jgi:hypothetical protein
VAELGQYKANLPWWKIMLLGAMAGAYVSLGGALLLTVGPTCGGIGAASPGLQKYIMGAIGFPFALLTILVRAHCGHPIPSNPIQSCLRCAASYPTTPPRAKAAQAQRLRQGGRQRLVPPFPAPRTLRMHPAPWACLPAQAGSRQRANCSPSDGHQRVGPVSYVIALLSCSLRRQSAASSSPATLRC